MEYLAYVGQLAFIGALVLVLGGVSKLALAREPKGLPTYVSHSCSTDNSEDDKLILRLLNDGQVAIRTKAVDERQLPDLIARVMKFRAERAVYVTAENEVPYQRVITVIDEAKRSTDHLAVVLVPQFDPRRLETDWCVSSNMMWPTDLPPR